MKVLAISIMLVLVSSSALAAHSESLPASASTAANAEVRAQIEDATAAWNKAIINKNAAELESVLAAEFALTSDDATHPVARGAWLQFLQGMTFDRYSTQVVDVRTYGNIAVSLVQGEWDVTMNDKNLKEQFKVADFWVRRDGRWQVFRRHRIE